MGFWNGDYLIFVKLIELQNIMIEKELLELEDEINTLKISEVTENRMQEGMGVLMERITEIKRRFQRDYA